jgi:hypothetical protein
MDFILSKKAQSKGGDKYICTDDPTFSIYIPQHISRDSTDKPHDKLIITITPQSEINANG